MIDAHPSLAGAAPARASWIRMLLRSWCLGSAATPRGSPVAAALGLSLLWLLAWVLIDHWQRQPDPTFALDGIPLLAWYLVAVLGLAVVLNLVSRPRPDFGAATVLALGTVPLPLVLTSVAAYYLDDRGFWWAAGAVTLYVMAFLRRSLHAVTGRRQVLPSLLGVLCIAAFIWASDAVDAIPDLWNPREAAAVTPSEEELGDQETALFEQSARIDAALDRVQRDPAPTAQAFFLGFAGVGEQKVFAQEIGLASRVLGERYHMGDRHLSLVNDARDVMSAPLASVTALNYALAGLAERMDLSKDVLFLSISSHGSEEPSIAVSNAQLPFMALTPDDLRDALHEAGIQWRVIIISACYAGGFIEALRDPKTIVVTAAARDRTSFGCSNDADLTYFGEAFYRDALPQASSLRAAFAAAKKAIAAREHAEHETASDPQAYFGADIEKKLAEPEGVGI